MDENKLRGLMGLCVRARQAVFGEDGCMKAIRAGHCCVVLVDNGASDATKSKYRGVCSAAGVRMEIIPENLLAEATGRPGVAMAVTAGGLGEQLSRIFSADSRTVEPMKSGNKCGGASVE